MDQESKGHRERTVCRQDKVNEVGREKPVILRSQVELAKQRLAKRGMPVIVRSRVEFEKQCVEDAVRVKGSSNQKCIEDK